MNSTMRLQNCSLISLPVPVTDVIYLEKMQFYKFQVDSFHGKGGGLKYIEINGTRLGVPYQICTLSYEKKQIMQLLGSLLPKYIDAKEMNCTVKKQRWPSWSCCTCKDAIDGKYDGGSFWYTVIWQGGIGTWISIPMPK